MKISKNTLIGIGSAVSIVGAISYFAIPKKETITVKYLTWKREVDIKEYREVTESGWEVPEGATVINVSKNSSENTTIEGGSIRIDTTTKPYYTYTINRWVVVNKNETTGDKETREPYYDTDKELPEGSMYGDKRETYYIVDTNGNIWTVDYGQWSVLKGGEKLIIKNYRGSKHITKMKVVN